MSYKIYIGFLIAGLYFWGVVRESDRQIIESKLIENEQNICMNWINVKNYKMYQEIIVSGEKVIVEDTQKEFQLCKKSGITNYKELEKWK